MTVIALLPLVALLLTTFAYICDAGVLSLFQPRTAGVIKNVDAPLVVVLTSVRTPEPGVGSVPSDLLASFDLEVESVYKITYAGALIATFKSEKVLPGVGIVMFADAVCVIDPVLAFVVVLDAVPLAAQLKFPDPSVFKNCPFTMFVGKVNV